MQRRARAPAATPRRARPRTRRRRRLARTTPSAMAPGGSSTGRRTPPPPTTPPGPPTAPSTSATTSVSSISSVQDHELFTAHATDIIDVLRLQDGHGQHGGAHDQRHEVQALQRRRRGERQQRVQAGGGVPGRDADGGGRQLLLLGRRGRRPLPEGDAVRGRRRARPRASIGAGVVLRAALRRTGWDAGRRGCGHLGCFGCCLVCSIGVVKSRMILVLVQFLFEIFYGIKVWYDGSLYKYYNFVTFVVPEEYYMNFTGHSTILAGI
jgi:hypothetical protein